MERSSVYPKSIPIASLPNSKGTKPMVFNTRTKRLYKVLGMMINNIVIQDVQNGNNISVTKNQLQSIYKACVVQNNRSLGNILVYGKVFLETLKMPCTRNILVFLFTMKSKRVLKREYTLKQVKEI